MSGTAAAAAVLLLSVARPTAAEAPAGFDCKMRHLVMDYARKIQVCGSLLAIRCCYLLAPLCWLGNVLH